MTEIALPDGWHPPTNANKQSLLGELAKELVRGHPLYQMPLTLIAYRTDDLLVQPIQQPNRFIIVHLTWKMGPEINAKFPAIEYDGDLAGLHEYEQGLDASS